jgi:hypothetical protein
VKINPKKQCQSLFKSKFLLQVDLELIMTLASIDRECQVDAAKDIVRIGLSIEQSLTLIVTLES